MTPNTPLRNTWKGYLLAVVLSGVITLLKLLLAEVLEHHSAVVLFPIAVLLVAWFAGLGPSLLAAVLVTFSVTFFFIEPAWQLYVDDANAQYVAFFFLEALLFCGLVYGVQRYRDELQRSEERATNILESISDIFFSLDRSWHVTYINRNAARVFERPAEEIIGQNLWELPPNFTNTTLKAPLHEAMKGNTPIRFEGKSDVTGHWYEATIYPLEDGISVYARDITERKQAERKQKEHEKRLHLALEAAEMVTWEWNPITEEINVSDQFERVFGLPSAEDVDQVLQLIHPDDIERHQHVIRQAAERGEAYNLPFRIIRPSTQEAIWLEEWGYAEHDEEGQLQRMVGVAMDVTTRKRYEEGLKRAKEEAEELASTKTALLANMSHEVRTPLTGLLLLAEILANRLEGENREKVLKIKKGAEKLSHLLDAVLTLSRLEAGHVDIRREVVNVVEEAEQAVASLWPLAEKKGLALSIEGPPACHALADDSSLDSVLNNLIGNAIKFTEEGAITVRIERTTLERVGGDGVTIHVQDTGKGISPAFMPHIFDEFRQESTGVGRTHDGAGLGLAISKRLITLMNGVITVESEPGAGTTFSVTLPAAIGDDVGLEHDEPPQLEQDGTRPYVLAMDDDELTLELVPELLEGACEVKKASTPHQAIALATSERFDIVLLDISMPTDLNGVDVLHVLRQHPHYRSVPIIAMTAYALPGDKTRFLNQGFDGYVSKPFTRPELMNAVHKALSDTASTRT